MGQMIYNPIDDNHKHDYPKDHVGNGALYKCSCGKFFIAKVESDYRESWLTWNQITQEKCLELAKKRAAEGHAVHSLSVLDQVMSPPHSGEADNPGGFPFEA